MKISFADDNEMITLPVTPPEFKIPKGINIETVSLSEIGDYIFAGHTSKKTSISDVINAPRSLAATSSGTSNLMPGVLKITSCIRLSR